MLADLKDEKMIIDMNEEGETFDLFLEDSIDRSMWTPDMRKIMKDKFHLLFTYGTLKSTEYRSNIMESEFIGNATTAIVNYNLFNYEAGRYPVALLGSSNNEKKAPIYGEVHLVPNYVLPILDTIEQNGRMFQRVRTFVTMSSNKYTGTRPILGVWMYLGVKRLWETKLDELSPCPLITPKTKGMQPFYNYTSK